MGFKTPERKHNWDLFIFILFLGSFQSIRFTLFQNGNNAREGDTSNEAQSPTRRWQGGTGDGAGRQGSSTLPSSMSRPGLPIPIPRSPPAPCGSEPCPTRKAQYLQRLLFHTGGGVWGERRLMGYVALKKM